MAISRERLKEEIVACEAAIEQHKIGLEVQKIVLEAFKKKLKKTPQKKEENELEG